MRSVMNERPYTFYDYLSDKRPPCSLSRHCKSPDKEHWKLFKHAPQPTNKTHSKAEPTKSPTKTYKLPKTMHDKKSQEVFIKKKFLVSMPEDFWAFWDFCRDLHNDVPQEALKSVGLTLVGPFDVLGSKFAGATENDSVDYLLHWRYYYDPPEFQTVLKGDDSTGFHIGYFRDDPKEVSSFVGSNCAVRDGIIETVGDNLFAAVYGYLEDVKNSGDPFVKVMVPKLQSKIKLLASNGNFDLNVRSERILKREAKILTRSLNKAGLIVPYVKKSQQGYRPLPMSNKELKLLLTRLSTAKDDQQFKELMSKFQPVITAAMIATDEMDLGTAIELGWDILSVGIDSLNNLVESLLCPSYSLLKRNEFAQICRAHMNNRKKGHDLSVL